MDNVLRKLILTGSILMGLTLAEPPLSNQYGVPGNYAPPSVNQYQQSQDISNSYGVPQGDSGHGGNGDHGGYSGHSGNGGHGGGHDEHQDYVDSQPKSYEFGYAVKDAASGNDFGRRESSDGETVRGEYRVQLPDGRTQIVTYTADWRTGFHADVRYEGEAQYPEQYNNNNNNQGYGPNANSNYNNNGYNYNGGNSVDSGYNSGNQGNYNNYQSGSNYNSAPSYTNYQYGSNTIDSSGASYADVPPPLPSSPQSTYGTPYRRK